jgi:hypothetical protein
MGCPREQFRRRSSHRRTELWRECPCGVAIVSDRSTDLDAPMCCTHFFTRGTAPKKKIAKTPAVAPKVAARVPLSSRSVSSHIRCRTLLRTRKELFGR